VRILGQHKDKQSLTQYIMAKEANDDVGDNAMPNSKSLMFDKMHPSMA